MARLYGLVISVFLLVPAVNQGEQCPVVDPERYDDITVTSPNTEVRLTCEANEPIIKLWKCVNGQWQQVLGDKCVGARTVTSGLNQINCSVTVDTHALFFCTRASIGDPEDEPYKYFNVSFQPPISFEPDLPLPQNPATTSETPTSVTPTRMTSTIPDTMIPTTSAGVTTETGTENPRDGGGISTAWTVVIIVTLVVIFIALALFILIVVVVVVKGKKDSSGGYSPEQEPPQELRPNHGENSNHFLSDQEGQDRGGDNAQHQREDRGENETSKAKEGSVSHCTEICTESTLYHNMKSQMISPKFNVSDANIQTPIELPHTEASYTHVPFKVPECPRQLSFSDYNLEIHLSQVKRDLSKISLMSYVFDDSTYIANHYDSEFVLLNVRVTESKSDQDGTSPSSPVISEHTACSSNTDFKTDISPKKEPSDTKEERSKNISPKLSILDLEKESILEDLQSTAIEDQLSVQSEDMDLSLISDSGTEIEMLFLDSLQECEESTLTVPVIPATTHRRTSRHHDCRRTVGDMTDSQQGKSLEDPNGVIIASTHNMESGNDNSTWEVCAEDNSDFGAQPLMETGRPPAFLWKHLRACHTTCMLICMCGTIKVKEDRKLYRNISL